MSTEKCGGEFSKEIIKECVSEQTFKTFEDNMIISEVISFSKILDNYQTCPFCEQYACIIDQGITIAKCGRCEKSWCAKCRRIEHGTNSCNKISDATDLAGIRRAVHETMTQALTHTCPCCFTKYIKETGCNFMHCTSCKAGSCYLCGIKVSAEIGYKHFGGLAGCKLYNTTTNESDQGNAKYNNTKLIEACNNLLKENSPNVQKVMKAEMIAQGIFPKSTIEPKENEINCIIS